MKLAGKAVKYGENIDTDVIIPARYLNTTDPAELASHCMEDLDSGFAKRIADGAAIIAAGKNFGCGSSREHAPIALKAAGISCVIAETFARIFFRNSINTGLPILECPEAARDIRDEDYIEIDLNTGTIFNKTTGRQYSAQPFPEFMRELIEADGLINYTRKRER